MLINKLETWPMCCNACECNSDTADQNIAQSVVNCCTFSDWWTLQYGSLIDSVHRINDSSSSRPTVVDN